MSKKQQQSIFGILALLVVAWIIWNPLSYRSTSATVNIAADASSEAVRTTPSMPSITAQPTSGEGGSNANAGDTSGANQIPAYQLAQTKSSFDPVADAKHRKERPFRFVGSGAGKVGKIVDHQGNVIMATDPEKGLYMFSIEVSPDGKRIAIYRGSAKYDIFDPSTGETIRLPQIPPGDNVLGFSWHWIDDKTLIGVSGIIAQHNHEHTGDSCKDPHISQSVLYRYDLNEQKISQIALPPILDTKIVSVRAVDETGKVQLWPDGQGDSYTDASLGWFEIRPTE